MHIDYVSLVSRWLHILAAMTAVGGTIFMRMALLPSVSVLPEESRKQLHEAVRSRWSKFVMAAILFLLVSGGYNFVMVLKQLPDSSKGLYHALFGIKFLFALAIFFIASALAGRSEAFAGIRKNARLWLTVNLVMAIVLVCISGVLRAIPHQAAAVPTSVNSSERTRAGELVRRGRNESRQGERGTPPRAANTFAD